MSKQKKKQPLRCFTFSPEMIQVTQKAMILFAQSLARAEGRPEKVAFAREIMQQVKNKLDTMKASVGAMCLTAFDYNEKMVIATAIRLYMADLRPASASSQRARELKRCQRIMGFALDPGQDDEQANKTSAESRNQ